MLVQKKIWSKKKFWSEKKCCYKKILVKQKFSPTKFWSEKEKHYWSKKNLVREKNSI